MGKTALLYYLQFKSVRLQQQNPMGGIWFITFTCFKWKPLFELKMPMMPFINGSIISRIEML
jgi:hypothetical protein